MVEILHRTVVANVQLDKQMLSVELLTRVVHQEHTHPEVALVVFLTGLGLVMVQMEVLAPTVLN